MWVLRNTFLKIVLECLWYFRLPPWLIPLYFQSVESYTFQGEACFEDCYSLLPFVGLAVQSEAARVWPWHSTTPLSSLGIRPQRALEALTAPASFPLLTWLVSWLGKGPSVASWTWRGWEDSCFSAIPWPIKCLDKKGLFEGLQIQQGQIHCS